MDQHLNIWLILLLSLPFQDKILGPGMQLCWYHPAHGANLHLVTKPFSRQLPTCGNNLRAEIRNIQGLTSFQKALKPYFLNIALIDSFLSRRLQCAYENISVVYAHYN